MLFESRISFFPPRAGRVLRSWWELNSDLNCDRICDSIMFHFSSAIWPPKSLYCEGFAKCKQISALCSNMSEASIAGQPQKGHSDPVYWFLKRVCSVLVCCCFDTMALENNVEALHNDLWEVIQIYLKWLATTQSQALPPTLGILYEGLYSSKTCFWIGIFEHEVYSPDR